ncbi:hypothetical protein HXX02_17170 [Microbulbifer elongatus]|uniref:Uncharacterized protein n=1 Tax=Microbulbifer elongatus TaxID=86173 RepID=A0ABT1P6Q2_9GAMM|nr:hypothetical protein [Microbulbifer elongatus]MCQ3831167.1 hypothetical protein [Microbulbifer elongatus]
MKRIKELTQVLNEQVIDLLTGVTIYRNYFEEHQYDPNNLIHAGVQRMCINHIVISLSKLWEAFAQVYGKEFQGFPEALRKEKNRLQKYLDDKKVYQFRSKYVAHLIDKETGSPICSKEGASRLSAIVGTNHGEMLNFLSEISPLDDETGEAGIVGVVQRLNQHCYGILSQVEATP